ncbi:MAG: RNA polymerase sigma factor [Burkholderiaceae bacterium]
MDARDLVEGAIDQAARNSYGRLIAFLSARSHDVAAAEDALSDAFHAALEHWPRTGIPDRPEAWLLTSARRKLIDAARHVRVRDASLPTLAMVADAEQLAQSSVDFPDERLKLLFICAHPAIDAAARTPLMLQTVLGLDAARIASAFLARPSAMGQRLSRAKTKIRDAGIGFEVPDDCDLPPRVDAVLEAIYAAYGSGWDDVAGADARRKGLALEAIALGRLMRQLMPAEPEVASLLALMLHCQARLAARRANDGAYLPLSEQDVGLWSRPMIAEGDALLRAAERAGRVGRFQLEGAIQSLQAQRLTMGRVDWPAIAWLYEGLAQLFPTIGGLVGRAAAVAEARGAGDGYELLTQMPPEAVQTYQPYWALAAHLLTRLGRIEDARAAYGRAIGLCEDPAMRAFLAARAG